MTKRTTITAAWASGGSNVKDPDLDTSNPSYVANKYSSVGWTSEKPPEEWQNFLSQITDLKVLDLIVNMAYPYESGVSYKQNAIVRSSSGELSLRQGSSDSVVIDTVASNYSSILSSLQSIYNTHINADNPHNDTVNTLVDKSYIKSDVDDFFGALLDPRTVVYHKAKTGRAHGETPAQLGTLPVAGGIFTGSVSFIGSMIFSNANKTIRLNTSTMMLELSFGNNVLCIDSAGNVFYKDSQNILYEILCEANWDKFETSNNPLFALPAPTMSMYTESSLSNIMSVGKWTLETASVPVFETGRGLKIAGNTITVSKQPYNHPLTFYMYGTDNNGATVSAITDSQAWDVSSFQVQALATLMGIGNLSNLKMFAAYPQLTAYQKTMLVR